MRSDSVRNLIVAYGIFVTSVDFAIATTVDFLTLRICGCNQNIWGAGGHDVFLEGGCVPPSQRRTFLVLRKITYAAK